MSRKAFNTRWAQGVETQDSSTSFQEPDNIRLSTGWEGGADKDAPPAGQENWWHNRVDSALQGVERTGVMAYHSQAIYGIGAPTYATDGNYYESLVAGNTGNDPVSTSGFWRIVGVSFFSGADPGDLKMVAHNKVPTQGWLKCNGAAVLKASYPRLFAMIGTIWNTGGETSLQFRLPDYRGVFVRGFTDGGSIDVGRSMGAIQDQALQSHNHYMPTNSGVPADVYGINDGSFSRSVVNYNPAPGYVSTTYPNPAYGSGSDIGSIGTFAGETRPINKTVNYWIKY